MTIRRKEVQAKYYRTHMEQAKAYAKTYRKAHQEFSQRYKYEVLSHYSEGIPKCNNCGITDMDVLCIDHINGGGKKHRKEVGYGLTFYRWLFHNEYPSGFQVLCFNCNMKKRISLGV